MNTFTFIAVSFLLWMGSAFARNPESQHWIEKGQEVLESDPEQAKLFYQKALEIEYSDVALKGLGWGLWKTGDTQGASEIWERLILNSPDDEMLYIQLAKIYTERGDLDKALAEYAKAENRFGKNINLGVAKAKLLIASGKFSEALEFVEANTYLDDKTIGFVYFENRDFNRAIIYLKRYLESNPEDLQALSLYGRALFHSGEYGLAVPLLEKVRSADSQEVPVRDVLSLNYQYTGELDKAIICLQELAELKPSLVRFDNQIGKLRMDQHKYDLAIEAFERSLKKDATQTEPRLAIADSLLRSKQYEKAQAMYEKIFLEQYPNIAPRIIGALVDAQELGGDVGRAEKNLEKIVDKYPDDHNLVLRLARVYASNKQYDKAFKLLSTRATHEKYEAVPAFLYHRISSHERDGVVTARQFDDQIKSLRDAGYSSITTEDLLHHYDGTKQLPQKSVLITFDDAMKDSWVAADPILKKYNFIASMFVPVSVIDEGKPFFMNWNDLREMQDTGRWDIQCHSHSGHKDIMINAKGAKGRFLINRMWLESENRLETENEFKVRIERDYELCKDELEKKIPGAKVFAYSYPFGDFGAESLSNSLTDVIGFNLGLVKKYYKLSFIQKNLAFNAPNNNPWFSMRTNVPSNWKGSDVISYLETMNPAAQASVMMANAYAEEGQYDKAIRWANKGKLMGADAESYSKPLSISYEGLGDDVTAISFATSVSQTQRLEKKLAPTMQGKFRFFADKNQRSLIEPIAQGDFYIGHHWFGDIKYGYGIISQKDVTPTGSELNYDSHAASIGALYKTDDTNLLSVNAGFRYFVGSHIAPDLSVRGRKSIFRRLLYIEPSIKYRPMELARAVQDEAQEFGLGAVLGTAWFSGMKTSLRYQYSLISDDNQISAVVADWRHVVWQKAGINAGLAIDYRDSKLNSNNYYSPQNAVQLFLPVEWSKRVDQVRWNLSYAPGFGRDDFESALMIHYGAMDLEWLWKDTLKPYISYSMGKSPSYWSLQGVAGVQGIF